MTVEFHEADWHNCYDGGWGDLLVPEAFAHPAKFSRALIMRIIDHGLKQGYWQPGDLIGDPFGGVALGGIAAGYRGLNWLGVELEERFVDLGSQNLRKHAAAFRQCGATMVKLVQGDSRNFKAIVAGELAACVTSPPYAEGLGHGGEPTHGCGRSDDATLDGMQNGYGQTPGNIGNLPAGDLAAVVTSPPYNLPMSQEHPGRAGGTRGTEPSEPGAFVRYGCTPGQIEGLPSGSLAAVVTSPPFTTDQPCASQTKALKDYHAFTRGDGTKRDQGMQSEGNIAGLPSGSLDACLTSPPYAESVKGDHRETETAEESREKRKTAGGSLGQSARHGGYGASEGQIGALRGGSLDAAVTSPPFDAQVNRGGGGVYAKWCEQHGRNPKAANAITQNSSHQWPESEGQLGNSTGDTYWAACREVYEQVRLALKPGGVLALVVKSYVKQGKIVDLPAQTCDLLSSLGFDVFELTRAWLVKKEKHPSLFGGEEVHKTERKSFFRRLHEKKRPDLAIDYEVVIWSRKRMAQVQKELV